MKKNEAHNYVNPCDQSDFLLRSYEADENCVYKGEFIGSGNVRFKIENGIPDLTFPQNLHRNEKETKELYQKLADQYHKFADIPFRTFKTSEKSVRTHITDKLNLTRDSCVLEIGAGDGRGAECIAQRLGRQGKLFVQELAPAFLDKAMDRLNVYEKATTIEYSIANAMYLSFADNTFDAVHHFGGMNTFSDIARCLKELTRVVKPGGKVVVGDESMAPWLRHTEFGKIMMNSNPLLKCQIPFDKIPVEARDVKVEWIMMGAFFVLDYAVGASEPEANYHIPIPGERGGSHWTRYYGKLEGVQDETKKMAYRAQKKSGKSMSDWLDWVVRSAAEKEIKQ